MYLFYDYYQELKHFCFTYHIFIIEYLDKNKYIYNTWRIYF